MSRFRIETSCGCAWPAQLCFIQHVVTTIKPGGRVAKVLTDNSGFVKMEEGVGKGFLR